LVKDWILNTRYCGRCGARTTTLDHEWGNSCPDCGHTAYPRMSPAVIVAVIKEGKILLAHNRRFTTPVYSLIAGFVEAGEDLEGAVHREILEETGLRVKNVRYFDSQCWPFPDSLMVAYVAEYASGELKINEELMDAQWFDRDNMPDVPVRGPISRMVIDWYLETGGYGALRQEMER
jgi:NAD+ diphosphatase